MIFGINLLTIVLLPIGCIIIQIFLSNNQKKYSGLIIPAITFIFSIIVIIQTDTFKKMISAFILCNIITIISLVILFICKRNINKKNQINKMKIQDLE